MSVTFLTNEDKAVIDERIDSLNEDLVNKVPTGAAAHQMLVTDASGAAKWEDRTHYADAVKVVYTYDGNREGREVVDMTALAGDEMYLVKIGDDVPDANKLVGGTLLGTYEQMNIGSIGVNNLFTLDGGYMVGSEFCLCVTNKDTFNFDGLTLPSVGVWLLHNVAEGSYVKELSYTDGAIKPLDPKYLPNTHIVFTYDGTNYTCNMPYDEFKAAVLAGHSLVYVDTSNKWSSSNVSVSYNQEGEYWAVNAVNTCDDVTVTLHVTESGVEDNGR